MSFFKLLETKASEVNIRNMFLNKYIYVPDFFITSLFTSLIIISCFLDLALSALLFFNTNLTIFILYVITAYIRVIFEIPKEKRLSSGGSRNGMFGHFYKLLFTILGLHSLVNCWKILTESFQNLKNRNELAECVTYPVFHISNENLDLIKIYCYIYTGTRCIPHTFIVSTFIGLENPHGVVACLSTISIMLNIVLFALMISITIPIRKTPRIFNNSSCLVLSASNKFLATICGCYSNLLVFIVMFRNIKYYAFLAHFVKTAIWIFPCQTLLSTQPIRLTKLQFVTYLIFFPIVFSFIFIHPLEKTWRLFYYFFYLLLGLMDLAYLGVWADGGITEVTSWFILRVLEIAFISCYGLLNSLKKGKPCLLDAIFIEIDDAPVSQDEDVHKVGTSTNTKDKNVKTQTDVLTENEEIQQQSHV